MQIQGKYAVAEVLTDNIDQETISQIITLLGHPMFEGQKVVIQPDCHAGKGAVIGFTATFGDTIIPNIVGVDIGCGVSWYNLGKAPIDLKSLDRFIHEKIPSGRRIHAEESLNIEVGRELSYLLAPIKDKSYLLRSVGTLGGGNHFCEVSVDDEGNHYLIVHSGSRNLGVQVATHYQNLAYKDLTESQDTAEQKRQLIEMLKSCGGYGEIEEELSKISKPVKIAKDLAHLNPTLTTHYLHDMDICVKYASINRKTMIKSILNHLKVNFKESDYKESIHNYVDTKMGIIRKGAIKSEIGQEMIIPISMRDGSLIAVGIEGCEEVNFSAPHGAGRVMSRTQAKEQVSLADYQKSMEGIYTSCVNQGTLDESPFAYKSLSDIIDNVKGIKVVKHIKPIYNFKASE